MMQGRVLGIQLVKCLQHKHKNLSLIFCTHVKIRKCWHTYDLNAEEGEAGGSLELAGQSA